MLRFLKKSSKVDEEREKLKKDLFQFTRCVDHGFPNKPSALAYDPKLELLAVGTKTGTIKVYGAPGVEFTGIHEQDVAVNQLYFLPEQGRIISLCSDNSLHLWEINVKEGESVLEEVNKFSMESNKMKTISVCCLSPDAETLLLGTEGGNIHTLDVKLFTLMEQVIYQDVVMQNVPDDFKVSPGAVEAIAVHPLMPSKILIGYNRGLIVQWDNDKGEEVRTYNVSQQLESLTWHYSGSEFMSSHADGSYVIWALDSDSPKQASTPYGPFPCKGIGKILWKTSKSEPYVIFSGGMPRASYGDRHTVSVMQGDKHAVFDFTSRIIDFITLQHSDSADTDERTEHEDPHSLVVLVEEELVVIDLETDNWPVFANPYMNSVHSSAITCSQHIANVPTQLWEKLTDAGLAQNAGVSTRDWPINGGRNLTEESSSHDLFLTGHEDGSIRLWEASGISLRFIYKVSTSVLFGMDHTADAGNEEEEWPPFRKVGTFDPYSDDPRLGIQKISLCPLSETLAVAGTAGQVIVLQMERDERQLDVKCVEVNLITDREDFVWKGHDALTPVSGDRKYASGFQPSVMLQLSPPAACTSLALHAEWQLLAVGTSHGFALFDYLQNKEVFTRCTLSRTDVTATTDSTMSRRKSFKQSLRDSFRRIRKRRSERRKHRADDDTKKDTAAVAASPAPEETPAPPAAAAATSSGTDGSPDRRPIERQVEARGSDDYKTSLVRCVYLVDTFVSHAHTHTPSLWVGTNAGHIYIHVLTVPASDKRSSDAVTCTLAKEIKLRHRAPVVAMCVMDQHSHILPDPLEVQHERAKAAEMSGHHQVLICSEEQFKVFSLPQLRPVGKVKITSADGSCVRKVGFINFRSKADANYTENDIACLTNLGTLAVYTVPGLKKQMFAHCAKKEDIKWDIYNGISSFIFTKAGQGFYMSSSSEVSRISLSACVITRPNCDVELKEGMRPPPPEPEPVPEPQGGAGIEITIDPAPPSGGEDVDMNLVEAATSDEHDPRADVTADTTADITVDSVTVNPDVSADISGDSGDVVTTTTTEVVEGGEIRRETHTSVEVVNEVSEIVTTEVHTTTHKMGGMTVTETRRETMSGDDTIITTDTVVCKTVDYDGPPSPASVVEAN